MHRVCWYRRPPHPGPEFSYTLGTHHLISGGGARVFVACKFFFFTSERKQSFFLAINVRRNFLSYAFAIIYVTIWFFSWSTYFSSISATNFFYCPHFQQTLFSDFCGDKLFISIFFRPPPPPDIK